MSHIPSDVNIYAISKLRLGCSTDTTVKVGTVQSISTTVDLGGRVSGVISTLVYSNPVHGYRVVPPHMQAIVLQSHCGASDTHIWCALLDVHTGGTESQLSLNDIYI